MSLQGLDSEKPLLFLQRAVVFLLLGLMDDYLKMETWACGSNGETEILSMVLLFS